MPTAIKNKVSFIVHNGWGIATEPGLKGNAGTTTTNMDKIGKKHSQRRLAAHGTAVGLSDGLIGNSKVGHLNIGTGRVVWQDIVRIDSFKGAKDENGRLHLLGLISDGGPRCSGPRRRWECRTHTCTFRRWTRYCPAFCGQVLLRPPHVHGEGKSGGLATVVERYCAMDRDKRWERIKITIDGEGAALSEGTGVIDEIKGNYEKDVTDEFLKPIIVYGEAGRIKDGDTLFFFNYRSEHMREIVSVLGLPDRPTEVTVPKEPGITTMSRYNSDSPFPAALPPQEMTTVLAESRDQRFQGVADKVVSVVDSNEYDLLLCNFTPPDMVGRTGNSDAAVFAITHTDAAVGTVQRATCCSSDDGNAEQMRNADTGAPHTTHTCNPVPFILAGPASEGYALVPDDERTEHEEEGALCDIAPTVLALLGIPKPEEVTGRSLLAEKK
ncbi:phosphoglycerate mutase [Mycena latifolia]|nr:phosphoglycerate mutase [Mycena latifolia]